MGISSKTVWSNNTQFGLLSKKQIIADIAQEIKVPYHLDEQGDCHRWGGWRYLSTIYGVKPNSSSADASLGWLYPGEIGSSASQLEVVIAEARDHGGYMYKINRIDQ